MLSFRATRTLFFSVGGIPTRATWREEELYSETSEDYFKIFKLCARLAAKEQGWMKNNDMLFICIKIYFSSQKRRSQESLPRSRPYISVITQKVLKALKGIIYDSEIQVGSIQVIKSFSEKERVEIFIGTVEVLEDLYYDLQQTEKDEAKLESK